MIAESTHKYRHDPVYRAKHLERTKRRHKENSRSITYRRLVYVRKQIYNVRESVDLCMRKLEGFEKKLKGLMVERDGLVVKWKNYRNAQKYRRISGEVKT